MSDFATIRRVAAWRERERSVLERLAPPGSTVREVRAMLRAALGVQYAQWIRQAGQGSDGRNRNGIKGSDGESTV